MERVTHLLDEAAQHPINSTARTRLDKCVRNETGITNINQVAGLVEAVALQAALENGKHDDEETAEAPFAQAQTISAALRQMHELIYTIA